MIAALIATLCALAPRTTAAELFCTGDCDGSGVVTVEEIIRGVSITLGNAGLEICLAFDVTPDNRVTVDELVAAVASALAGCRVRPTPTPPATFTRTRTATPSSTPTLTPVPLLVTTLIDEQVGSLRDRIAAAVAGDTIHFAVTGVISLTGGPLIIDKDLTIEGPGAPLLTVSGGQRSRVFEIRAGAVTLADITIADGRVEGSSAIGAGILNDGNLMLDNCIVRDNRLVTPANCFGFPICAGAGIFSRSLVDLRMNRTSIVGNDAGNGGAGGVAAASAFIRDSTISGNRAGAPGGGLACFGPFASNIINSTISGNHTDGVGGGIWAQGQVELVFVTVSNNSAAGGGGIAFPCPSERECYSAFPILVASIIAAQSAGGNCLYGEFARSPLGRGGNVDDDGSCRLPNATDQSGVVDAGLLPLAANDGPTATHALQPTSPAVDAVPADACIDIAFPYDALMTDQRGQPRPSGPFCDSGAYELQQGGP